MPYRYLQHEIARYLRFTAGLILILLLAVGISYLLHAPGFKKTPPASSPSPEHPLKRLAFFEDDRGGIYGDSFPMLKEHAGDLDIISPVWLSISTSGAISRRPVRPEVMAYRRQKTLGIYPLINYHGNSAAPFLINPAARLRSLGSLLDLTGKFNGFVLDIEYLPPQYRNSLTLYVQELYPMLSQRKKQLYLCLFPQVGFSAKLAALHDYRALAPYCHGVILMAYDEHRPATGPGPVASLPWVEENILYALRFFPPEKIWLGIPVYGYRWPVGATPGKVVALPAREAEKTASKIGLAPEWDEEAAAPYYRYTGAGGQTYEVWYEDARSAALKYRLAKEYRLAGIAMWRLGYEVPGFWKILPERSPEP